MSNLNISIRQHIRNILSSPDSYKLTHYKQLYPGVNQIYENFTARSVKHLPVQVRELLGNKVVVDSVEETWAQIIVAFDAEFFSQPFDVVMKPFIAQLPYFTGGDTNTERYRSLHACGRLPITVKALPECTVVDVQVPFYTLINTMPDEFNDFAWLVGMLETVASNEVWKRAVNSTVALAYRVLLESTAIEQGTPVELVKWQAHDFSARGMSGSADATKSGISHLRSFTGTDGFGSVIYATETYSDLEMDSFIGGSILASEHMTETSAIQIIAKTQNVDLYKAELIQLKRFLRDVAPSGMAARVSDSYQYWDVITNMYSDPEVRELILNRTPDANGMVKFVTRPDTGIPEDIICGTAIPILELNQINMAKQGAVYVLTDDKMTATYYQVTLKGATRLDDNEVTPEMKGSVKVLWDNFGGTTTDKGFRVLDSRVGMIYGDSITVPRAKEIIRRLTNQRFAAINCFLGVGSYTYNMNTRDSIGGAIKATFCTYEDMFIDVNKNPSTDTGKKSAKGLLRVDYDSNTEITLFQEQTLEQEATGLLKTIIDDGKFVGTLEFKPARERIDQFVTNRISSM